MDAAAYLKSRGWRGKGHALHADKGLATPILVSRNTDGRGVGHTNNDQWWLHAFDQKLKGLDVSKNGVVTQTVTSGKLDSIATNKGKYSGLYAKFVSGGFIGGTLEQENADDTTDATSGGDEREAVPGLRNGVTKKGTKEERKAMRAARRARKAARAERRASKAEKRIQKAVGVMTGTEKPTESKEKRRARRAERRARKEGGRSKREQKATGTGG